MADYYNSSLTGEQIEKALLIAKKIGDLNGDIHSNGSGQASGITKSDGELFIAHYNHTGHANSTYSEVLSAYNAGKAILMINNVSGGGILIDTSPSTGFRFVSIRETGDVVYISTLTISGWTSSPQYLENKSNRVESITAASDNNHYPTAKAVYDAVEDLDAVVYHSSDDVTYDIIEGDISDNRFPIIIDVGMYYVFSEKSFVKVGSTTKNAYRFFSIGNDDTVYTIHVASDDTIVRHQVVITNLMNKVTQLTALSDNDHYPSAKCVYDYSENVLKAAKKIAIFLYGPSDNYAKITQFISEGGYPIVKNAGKHYLYSQSLQIPDPTLTTMINAHLFVSYNSLTNRSQHVYCGENNYWFISNEVQLEDMANRTESVTASSTRFQYPTAKAVYDAIQDIDADCNVEIFTYGDASTFAKVAACVTAGKYPILKKSDGKMFLYMNKENRAVVSDPIDIYQFAFFDTVRNSMTFAYCGENNFWATSESVLFESTGNKVNSITSASTTQYPSAKAVYDMRTSLERKIPIVLTYGSTDYTYSELYTLINLYHMVVFVMNTNGEYYTYRGLYVSGTKHILVFASVDILNYGIKYIQLADDESWALYSIMARTTLLNNLSTDYQYPTAKAVYSAVMQATLTLEYNDTTGAKPLYIQINQAYTNKQNVQLYIVKSGSSGNYNYAVGHFMGRHAETSGGTTTNYFVFVAYEMDVGKFVRYTVTSTDQWTRTEL